MNRINNFSTQKNLVVTFQKLLVPFEDVDVILHLSELFLHFLKDRLNLLVWPCIEAVVHVVTMLCGCRTDWGAISAISWLSESLARHKQCQEQQTATKTRGNTNHCANLIKAQLNRS